jgi:hypothetical protein
MGNGQVGKIHSLIPLADFKTVLGIDDRDDNLAIFCLKTATKAIEQYCKRHFLREKHFEDKVSVTFFSLMGRIA